MLELLKEVVKEVHNAARSSIGEKSAGDTLFIGADGTPTKRIDNALETIAINALIESGIPMLVVSEEAGVVNLGEEPEYICILDPLDGTHNAIKGIPFYSTSIAFSRYGDNATLEDVVAGVVMNLVNGELFEAEKGRGARCSGERIKTSKVDELDKATFAVYLQNMDIDRLKPLCSTLKGIRTLGSVALELCYVAMGSYEGLVDLRNMLKATDVAAGKLIVEEAGGIISGRNGEKILTNIQGFDRTHIIACGNASIHKKVLGVTQ